MEWLHDWNIVSKRIVQNYTTEALLLLLLLLLLHKFVNCTKSVVTLNLRHWQSLCGSIGRLCKKIGIEVALTGIDGGCLMSRVKSFALWTLRPQDTSATRHFGIKFWCRTVRTVWHWFLRDILASSHKNRPNVVWRALYGFPGPVETNFPTVGL